MKNLDHKTCKGCNLSNWCLLKRWHFDLPEPCPCVTCLVKSMCSVHCEERSEMWINSQSTSCTLR
jgi:hypothetical protein